MGFLKSGLPIGSLLPLHPSVASFSSSRSSHEDCFFEIQPVFPEPRVCRLESSVHSLTAIPILEPCRSDVPSSCDCERMPSHSLRFVGGKEDHSLADLFRHCKSMHWVNFCSSAPQPIELPITQSSVPKQISLTWRRSHRIHSHSKWSKLHGGGLSQHLKSCLCHVITNRTLRGS
jgi:hypothetical protein